MSRSFAWLSFDARYLSCISHARLIKNHLPSLSLILILTGAVLPPSESLRLPQSESLGLFTGADSPSLRFFEIIESSFGDADLFRAWSCIPSSYISSMFSETGLTSTGLTVDLGVSTKISGIVCTSSSLRSLGASLALIGCTSTLL